jgi:hypothetical protein
MKRIITIILVLVSISCHAQIDNRIKQIHELYSDYNENLSNLDTYEIKWNTAGSYPSAVIYTDYDGRLMIKTTNADEYGTVSSEYYFYKDTIQFIYSESERFTTHLEADTVRYELLELRYYFDKGEVIKTLKKQFNGIEGQDDMVDFKTMPNKAINHLDDYNAKWSYYEEKIKDLLRLYSELEKIF